MRHFDSLETVLDYIHDIFRTTSAKEICKVDSERLIEWYIAAQHYISCNLFIYTKELGYLDKFEKLETQLVFPKIYNTTWGGRCYHNGKYVRIEISIALLIWQNLFGVLSLLIHELSHIEIKGHSECFYKLQYENMQRVGLLSELKSFEDVFQKSPNQKREGETLYDLIGNCLPYSEIPLELPKGTSICYAPNSSEEDIVKSNTVQTIYNRYLKFRQHTVFKYPKAGPFRSLNGEYVDLIKKYTKEYNVDLNELLIKY